MNRGAGGSDSPKVINKNLCKCEHCSDKMELDSSPLGIISSKKKRLNIDQY